MYRQPEKNLLSSNTSSSSDNIVNFGPLMAQIGSGVWVTPANFNGFRVLAALLHGTLVVGVRSWCTYRQNQSMDAGSAPAEETKIGALRNQNMRQITCSQNLHVWVISPT